MIAAQSWRMNCSCLRTPLAALWVLYSFPLVLTTLLFLVSAWPGLEIKLLVCNRLPCFCCSWPASPLPPHCANVLAQQVGKIGGSLLSSLVLHNFSAWELLRRGSSLQKFHKCVLLRALDPGIWKWSQRQAGGHCAALGLPFHPVGTLK